MMFCSRSLPIHLLRGAGAALLIALAWWFEDAGLMLRAGAVIGAFALLRGCPMCWLMGLIETASRRRPEAQRADELRARPRA